MWLLRSCSNILEPGVCRAERSQPGLGITRAKLEIIGLRAAPGDAALHLGRNARPLAWPLPPLGRATQAGRAARFGWPGGDQ